MKMPRIEKNFLVVTVAIKRSFVVVIDNDDD